MDPGAYGSWSAMPGVGSAAAGAGVFNDVSARGPLLPPMLCSLCALRAGLWL